MKIYLNYKLLNGIFLLYFLLKMDSRIRKKSAKYYSRLS